MKKIVYGCIYSGLVNVTLLGTEWFFDGVTPSELRMALGAFIGGVFLYMKTHPTPPWDGTDRRTQ